MDHTRPEWLFAGMLHGWALIAINIALYAYLYWIAFFIVRGTEGRERIVMGGGAVGILIAPLKHLRPEWVTVIKSVGAVALLIAFVAAVSLLLRPAPAAADNSFNT